MTPYSRSIAAPWLLVTTSSNGSESYSGGSVATAYTSSLSCPAPNHGNFVDATRWSYTINEKFGLIGSTYSKSLTDDSGWVKTGCVGDINVPWPSRGSATAAYNLALSRLNDKVRGNLDLSIDLLEAGTTTRMIRSVGKILNLARKLRPSRGFGSTRDVANGYLQWKYGWKPLMSDIFDAANQSIDIVLDRMSHIKARGKVPLDVSDWVDPGGFNNVKPLKYGRSANSPCFEACELGVTLNVPETVHNVSRWTSLNPISMAWEIIPYSFVVDWFFDIGSYLRNMETGLLYNSIFVRGYKSTLFRYDVRDQASGTAIFLGSRVGVVGIERNTKQVVFDRSALAGYPLPQRPTINVSLSSSRLLSAAALLRQLLSK